MAAATVTSKGQITIPKKIRDSCKLHSGDRVEFFEDEEGQVFLLPATKDISALEGILPKPKNPVSIASMNSVIKNRGKP